MRRSVFQFLVISGLVYYLGAPTNLHAAIPCDAIEDFINGEENLCLDIRNQGRQALCAEVSAARRRLYEEYPTSCIDSDSEYCQDFRERMERARAAEQNCFARADERNTEYDRCMIWIEDMREALTQLCSGKSKSKSESNNAVAVHP